MGLKTKNNNYKSMSEFSYGSYINFNDSLYQINKIYNDN